MSVSRKNPNILVTGTPGVGKSTISKILANETNLTWLDISKIAKENNFLEEFDENYDCSVLDDDKVINYLEPIVTKGGCIVDYHSNDFFPEDWFDIVFVFRTNNTILYDRLEERGYQGKKLQENIECEIFQTILEEARNSYSPDIVVEMENNTEEDLEENIICIKGWIEWWRQDKNKT